MRLWLTIIISKGAYLLSRLIGRRGTTISGSVALRINPFLLKKMKIDVTSILFVTGTNGKTTTANLLANIMKQANQSVIHNSEGANMLTGVTASLIKAANWRGRVKADCVVLEVDEGSLPEVLHQMTPTRIVILNFFRDQLDRYGEIDVLIKNMMKAIKPLETELLLNSDDPLVMQFESLQKKTKYFGVKSGALHFRNYAQGESIHCPNCGNEMVYLSLHYGQLGNYKCDCGFTRKQPDFEVSEATTRPSLSFQIDGIPYTTPLKGSFNIYNVLAAISTAYESGVTYNHIQSGIAHYSNKNGRMETFYHQGIPYILNLNKNPSGTNVIINELMLDTTPKQLLIILNDHVADGEDVSWIWDVDFDVLNRDEIETVICAGTRSSELALRLKYAEVASFKIKEISDIQDAITTVLAHPIQTYILPTYTALEIAKQDLNRKVQPI